MDPTLEIKYFFNTDRDETDFQIKDSPEDFIVQEITSEEEICGLGPIIHLEKYGKSVKLLCFLFTNNITRSEEEILDWLDNYKEGSDDLSKFKVAYNSINYQPLIIKNRELRTSLHKVLSYNLRINTKTVEDKFIIKKSDSNTYTFVLKKVMMNTVDACKMIERNLGSSVSFAGNKDKKAVTYQEVSVKSSLTNLLEFAYEYTECTNEDYKNIKIFKNLENIDITEEETQVYDEEIIKKFKTDHFKSSIGIFNIRRGHPKRLGDLNGNKFTIRIRNRKDLKYKNIENGFINYYGSQRFGKAKNNHFVGEKILNKEYEEAVNLIIKNSKGYSDFIEGNYDECLKKCDNMERFIFKNLIKKPNDNKVKNDSKVENDIKINEVNDNKVDNKIENDIKINEVNDNKVDDRVENEINKSTYKKIILGMRREIRMIYLHSFQSYLFNKEVNEFIENNKSILKSESSLDFTLDLTKMNDKLLKGGVRNIFSKGKNVSGWQDGPDFVISFELKASCYATMALREL